MPLKDIFKKVVYRPSGRAMPGPVRYRIVGKYLGVVLLIIGIESLLTALLSIELGEGRRFYFFYFGAAVVYGAAGWYNYRRVPEKGISEPEVAVVASASFLFASIIGALPFVLLGHMPLLDAWFESMSGFTTTGFSLMDVASTARSLVFLRALSQWLGGMGFVVITVSILLVSGSTAVTLLQEGVEEKLFPRIARHIQVIFITYVAITAIGAGLLFVSGLSVFDALCYTLSGVSTGGFAPDAGSFAPAPYRSALFPAMLIMAAGATNFVLYFESWKRSRGRPLVALKFFFSNPQVLLLIVLIAVFGLAIGSVLESGGWLDGLFMAASAQTTTGYSSVAGSVGTRAMVFMIPAMFIGGAMGSTAGGIKLHRLMVFFKSFNRFILSREYPPEVILPGGITGKGVAKTELLGVFYIISVYAIFIVFSATVFILAGFDPLGSFFEVTSAAGTVGLSSGIVSPELGGGLKFLLICLMWGGRLEFIPVLIWLYSIPLRLR